MKLKCPVCGCTEIEKYTDSLIDASSYEDVYIQDRADYYVCPKCGHVELVLKDNFLKKFNKELAEIKAAEKKRLNEIKKNKDEIAKIQKSIASDVKALELYKEKLRSLKEKIDDVDITIRQQNDLKEEYKKISHECDKIHNRLVKPLNRIDDLKRKLKAIEK